MNEGAGPTDDSLQNVQENAIYGYQEDAYNVDMDVHKLQHNAWDEYDAVQPADADWNMAEEERTDDGWDADREDSPILLHGHYGSRTESSEQGLAEEDGAHGAADEDDMERWSSDIDPTGDRQGPDHHAIDDDLEARANAVDELFLNDPLPSERDHMGKSNLIVLEPSQLTRYILTDMDNDDDNDGDQPQHGRPEMPAATYRYHPHINGKCSRLADAQSR